MRVNAPCNSQVCLLMLTLTPVKTISYVCVETKNYRFEKRLAIFDQSQFDLADILLQKFLRFNLSF